MFKGVIYFCRSKIGFFVEFVAITRDLEEVKEYLTEGQQNRLAEIDREGNGMALNWNRDNLE